MLCSISEKGDRERSRSLRLPQFWKLVCKVPTHIPLKFQSIHNEPR